MSRYSPCRLCADYSPSYKDREKGFCHRVSDVAGDVFFAYTCPEFSCHFENGPMKTISEQEADKNFQEAKEKAKENRKKFFEVDERASKNVAKMLHWMSHWGDNAVLKND